ncbi:E3 ubiquitin-protein ligase TRIM39-like isoform X2 [Rhinatrema bivittatum]|nr:E3 ubiquitin-protein ligase TRIM39-like isoform X2 [Rhinatrema bivittatum]XP_029440502.1 E3 ubiquitin-protein ligase TRIM39-like isoform X2 [Rhinatrema bivittatum]
MAASDPTEILRHEVSCSICLDYFKEPVSIECGHNFCRPCISRCWEGLEMDFPCPQCRKRSRQRNLRPNRQLANVVEVLAKEPEMKRRRLEESNLCAKHEEKLKLFCEDDQEAICVICDRSRDHRAHNVIPIEEAVEEYKEKLESCLKPLKKELEEVLRVKSREEKRTLKLTNNVETQKQQILSEFEELQHLLKTEQQTLLSRLKVEEKEIQKRIRDNINALDGESSSLQKLIAEIEEKCQQPPTELLKDVRSTLSRYKLVKFQKPEAVFTDLVKELYTIPQECTSLRKLIKKRRVDITLDLDTANPYLVLSEDRKSVKRGDIKQEFPESTKRFEDHCCVLGAQGFTLGRRYWEVEIRDEEEQDTSYWDVGVVRKSVKRKGWVRKSPEDGGLWAVELCIHDSRALTSSGTPLTLHDIPRKVGVYLDYEAGQLSLYNAESMEHIYTFTDTFMEKVYPYFYIGYGVEIKL